MEGNRFQGDLADVVRASSGCGVVRDVDDHSNAGAAAGTMVMSSFPLQLPLNTDVDEVQQCFGDPFCSIMRDPLEGIGHGHVSSPSPSRSGFPDSSFFHGDFLRDETPFQISTTNSISDHHGPNSMAMSSCDFQGAPPGVNCVDRLMSPISPKTEPAEASSFIHTAGRVQISSPPQNPITKRRKSQAKKVVCIAAPTAANSRQGGGEVVPSDLWAWRKYGQKPIKGSPYPRGYYRCSSSKGCSARKQVERSRTDPNMLVITYTSEHNHPWPTQRNALAGSSRVSAPPQSTKKTNVKEEVGCTDVVETNSSVAGFTDGDIGPVEAAEDLGKGVIAAVTNQLSMMNDDLVVIDNYDDKSYRPVIMQDEACVSSLGGGDGDGDGDYDLFCDLRELEVDDLLHSRSGGGNKPMLVADPFGCLLDWPTSNTTTTNNNNDNDNDNDNPNLHQNS